MKNKIYLFNFPHIISNQKASDHYILSHHNLPIKQFALALSQGIIVYINDNNLVPDLENLNYFSKIHTINQDELINFTEKPIKYLDQFIGRERLINPKQFKIIKGSIVRNKIDSRLGAGYVKEILKDLAKVHFPKAVGYYDNTIIKCHISNLRIIGHIEELKNESQRHS